MSIPYRTRRKLNIFGLVFFIVSIIAIISWLCWVMWLQRYVVYEDGGARLDFGRSANEVVGEVAKPITHESKISIYYNEGADAITTTKDLEPINGYYITNSMVKQDMENVMLQVERLPVGTPVMIDMKGPYGSFFYSSNLGEAILSASTDIEAMDQLVQKLKSKGFYTIARISAFQDWNFGNNHVTSGLYMLSRAGLWLDPDGYFWLNPTDSTAISWIATVIMELRDMGFNEVLLDNFQFPNSDQYIFSGDKDAALQEAASKLLVACGSNDFTISFNVTSAAFPLPEGRCRLYVEDVAATQLATQAGLASFEDVATRLVFLSETGDTRFDEYSVLRSLQVAEEVEARKG